MTGDRGTARLATLGALVVIATFIAGKAARDALLLSSFPVTSLPVFVGGAAVVSFPLVLVTGRLLSRSGPARLVPLLNAASAALLVIEWLATARWPRPAAIAVYLHLAALGPVLVSGFWSLVTERLDPHAAKRHIGRIGLGATLGGILGGVIAERTAAWLPPLAILLVLAALQLGSAAALAALGRGRGHAAPAAEVGSWHALHVIARTALLRNIAGLVVLSAMGAAALDYVFKADLVGATAGPLRPLAIYYIVTNVATAVVQVALTGRVVRRLGVARSAGGLPAMLVGFGALALVVPVPVVAAIARGSELVVRNSIYRAAYELLFAPLPAADKRPAKVMIDVGADRVGDLLGSQLVAALLVLAPSPRAAVLVAAAGLGIVAIAVAARLPRVYTHSLAQSLLAGGGPAPEPWTAIAPTVGEPGDLTALSLLSSGSLPAPAPAPRAVSAASERSTARVSLAPRVSLTTREPSGAHASRDARDVDLLTRDTLLGEIADLRSGNPERVRRLLAQPLAPELAAYVLPLLGWDAVAQDASEALRRLAPRITGLLLDALLDPEREFSVRRRLPAALVDGAPALASWGLWRALRDPRFEVRYRAGKALALLHGRGHALGISDDDVFDAVLREVSVDARIWQNHRLVDGYTGPAPDAALYRVLEQRSATGLDHVFTLLGLALPAEPLRIALQAVSTNDPALRGTALEYLETVLPPAIRDALWPLLESDRAQRPVLRAPRELLAELNRSHPSIIASLERRAGRT